jgi:ferritin
MLISQKMNDEINRQIGREFGAMLQYVEIASHFVSESLPELARFFSTQADDERLHAMRFVKYIGDAGGRVVIPAVPAPPSDFRSTEEAVQKAADWEKTVTAQINALVNLAMKESDYTTLNFLQWFVTEQLEENSTMETLLRVVQRAGEDRILHVEEYLARQPGKMDLSGGEPIQTA